VDAGTPKDVAQPAPAAWYARAYPSVAVMSSGAIVVASHAYNARGQRAVHVLRFESNAWVDLGAPPFPPAVNLRRTQDASVETYVSRNVALAAQVARERSGELEAVEGADIASLVEGTDVPTVFMARGGLNPEVLIARQSKPHIWESTTSECPDALGTEMLVLASGERTLRLCLASQPEASGETLSREWLVLNSDAFHGRLGPSAPWTSSNGSHIVAATMAHDGVVAVIEVNAQREDEDRDFVPNVVTAQRDTWHTTQLRHSLVQHRDLKTVAAVVTPTDSVVAAVERAPSGPRVAAWRFPRTGGEPIPLEIPALGAATPTAVLAMRDDATGMLVLTDTVGVRALHVLAMGASGWGESVAPYRLPATCDGAVVASWSRETLVALALCKRSAATLFVLRAERWVPFEVPAPEIKTHTQ
jgi:hypothetical protein